MPAAVLGPVLGAAIAGAGTIAASQLGKPKGPPDISKEKKQALGGFAERLAREEEEFAKARGQDSILLRPGGQPIKFGPRRPGTARPGVTPKPLIFNR